MSLATRTPPPAAATDTLWPHGSSATPSLLAAFLASTGAVAVATGLMDVASSMTLYGAGALAAVLAASLGARRIVRGLRGDPAKIGPYTLGPKIGQGGMGEVYRARHAMMDRDVAIKILSEDHADEEGCLRFEREVRLTSQLESPNTVAIYDYGRTRDGRLYYVMEHVGGYDLENLVRKFGPLSPARTIRILRQACSALAEAHSVGVVHRDVKPANIALCERAGVEDVVKVLDFGLVEELGGSARPLGERPLTLSGTPAYLAPETILSPDVVDPRSDLYALGAVAYWLLTGTAVFDGNSVVEICSHHVHSTPEALSSRLGYALPADLEAVVLRCLEKDPSARHASMDELREALDACDVADTWLDEAGYDLTSPEAHEPVSEESEFGVDEPSVVSEPRCDLTNKLAAMLVGCVVSQAA